MPSSLFTSIMSCLLSVDMLHCLASSSFAEPVVEHSIRQTSEQARVAAYRFTQAGNTSLKEALDIFIGVKKGSKSKKNKCLSETASKYKSALEKLKIVNEGYQTISDSVTDPILKEYFALKSKAFSLISEQVKLSMKQADLLRQVNSSSEETRSQWNQLEGEYSKLEEQAVQIQTQCKEIEKNHPDLFAS